MIRLFTLLLAIFLLLPGALTAQTWEDYDYENLEFRGLGLEVGAVWPRRVESTLTLGLRADLGMLGPNVRVIPSLAFWSSRLQQSEVDRFAAQIIRVCERQRQPGAICPSQLDLGQVRLSDLHLNADLHYLFITPFETTPYLGAGVGLHLLNGQGEFINDTFIEELLDAISPSINLIGGVTVPLAGPLEVFGEARYVLMSDVSQASLSVGGIWRFTPVRLPSTAWRASARDARRVR